MGDLDARQATSAAISSGVSLAMTEMTPRPPSAIRASVKASPPEADGEPNPTA